jgi:hypothetical protein
MVIWLFVPLLVIVVLAMGFRWAYLYRGDSEWANAASIAGFFIAVVGFPLTIYSLFETQRAGREAQRQTAEAAREAKAAVEQARVDTMQALEKVAIMLLAADLERLHAAVNAVLECGDYADWRRALLHCREAENLAAALRVNPRLREDERTTLAQGAEALTLAHTSIYGYRINKNTETPGLPGKHAKTLRRLAQSLTAVRARLNTTFLEAPHAPAR